MVMGGAAGIRWFLILSVVIILAASPSVIAGSFELLRVDHIRTPAEPVFGYFPLRVEVANEGNQVAEDVHVRSWLPTFSDRSTGQINEIVGFNRGRWLLQEVPRTIPNKEYWVRVTISNDDERRVKHRLVTVDDHKPFFRLSSGAGRTDQEVPEVVLRFMQPTQQISGSPVSEYRKES